MSHRPCGTVMKGAVQVLALCLMTAFPAFPQEAATGDRVQGGPRTVLRGATVITGRPTAPIRDAVIVIDGDSIQAVGGKEIAYPPDATVIDVAGKFIIPGLIESHAHYEGWKGELFLDHGVTTAFAIGENLGAAKEASQKSASRTPRLYDTAADPRIDGSMNEAQVREGVREWLKSRPDFARLRDYTEETSRTFAWAADEIHKGGRLVFGHTMHAPESVRAGHDVVEHMWGFIVPLMSPQEVEDFKAGRHLHWSLFIRDWPTLEQSMRAAIAAGAYLNPTLMYELGSLSAHATRHEREMLWPARTARSGRRSWARSPRGCSPTC